MKKVGGQQEMRKEKIIQLVPEVYGSSAFLATNLFALTDKGHIWYKTSQGWVREDLPPELEPDQPPEPITPLPEVSAQVGDKKFFDQLAEKLEKASAASIEDEKTKK